MFKFIYLWMSLLTISSHISYCKFEFIFSESEAYPLEFCEDLYSGLIGSNVFILPLFLKVFH